MSRRLGEWPFALELARAMMRHRIDQGDSVGHAAERLLQTLDRKGPSGLARGTGDPRHRTIDGVLDSSLELLRSDDRKRLTELSIFPEDVDIPLRAASALWEVDEFDAEESAQRFARLYLLRLDLARGAMRLHDVMRSWLAAKTGNAAELHSRLIDAWPDWIRPPDNYAWRWLTWHLAGAGRTAGLERVLWNPEWLQAKLNATDVNALISDFDQLKLSSETALIQGAIRLSSHVLAKDPSQFASQIVGRLLPHKGQPSIQQFTDSFCRTARRPWLRPI